MNAALLWFGGIYLVIFALILLASIQRLHSVGDRVNKDFFLMIAPVVFFWPFYVLHWLWQEFIRKN